MRYSNILYNINNFLNLAHSPRSLLKHCVHYVSPFRWTYQQDYRTYSLS